MSTDVESRKELESQLNRWKAELAQLELKAAKAEPGLKRGCYSDIKALQEQRNRIRILFEDLEHARDEKSRERLRDELDRFKRDFEQGLQKCRERLEPPEA